MSEEAATTLCLLCQQREPYSPPACDPCRRRLAAALWEIRDLWSLLPAALGPGQGEHQRVSGSREAPLPLRVAAVDLALPARAGRVGDTLLPKVRTWFDPDTPDADGFRFDGRHRELVRDADGVPVLVPARDQDGALAVASVLDSWARDWSETFGLTLPAADVPALVSWLSRHLAYAINHHPAVEEFAGEVMPMLYALRSLLNVSRRPVHLPDACPACGTTALRRDPGGGDIVCGNCRRDWPYIPSEDAA